MDMRQNTEVVFRDQLTDGIDLGGRWQLLSFGPAFTADQGLVESSGDGLRVRSPGTNVETGQPVMEPAPHLGNHLKWVAQLTEMSSAGFPGRDIPADGVLSFHLQLGGRVYGADQHEFGNAVSDPGSDFRLGAAVMNVMDFESGIVFDFWVTNDAVYPFYERIMRQGPDDSGLSFSSAFPPVSRTADAIHDLVISYDVLNRVVTWQIDGEPVATVTRLGHPDPAGAVVLDHGGTPQDVQVRQLLGGFGIMTLMDAAWPPSGIGLVDLGLHYEFPTAFRGGSDTFGQGVELVARDFRITHTPSDVDPGTTTA